MHLDVAHANIVQHEKKMKYLTVVFAASVVVAANGSLQAHAASTVNAKTKNSVHGQTSNGNVYNVSYFP